MIAYIPTFNFFALWHSVGGDGDGLLQALHTTGKADLSYQDATHGDNASLSKEFEAATAVGCQVPKKPANGGAKLISIFLPQSTVKGRRPTFGLVDLGGVTSNPQL